MTPETESRVISVLKKAYRKHCLNDESVGWDELGDQLKDILCDLMGDKAYCLWLMSSEEGR